MSLTIRLCRAQTQAMVVVMVVVVVITHLLLEEDMAVHLHLEGMEGALLRLDMEEEL